MRIDHLFTDEAILAELACRITAARLARQFTQAALAKEAGVSKSTVERLENGVSVQLTSLIRCLRALGLVEALEQFLPETPVNPLVLLKRQGKVKQRVRSKRKTVSQPDRWTWGDE